jgi:hypothetical protein
MRLEKTMRTGFSLLGCLAATIALAAEPLVLQPDLVVLRSGPQREWSTFPDKAEHTWEKTLSVPRNERPQLLKLRQQDVKQAWQVLLNGKPLGELLLDERDCISCFSIPVGALTGKDDVLRIEPKGKHASSDDIRIGQINLIDAELGSWKSEQTAEVVVVDADSGRSLPCCLTIVDERGSLVPLGIKSSQHLAVRTGVVYTSTGEAQLKLPPGKHTIYATRGFEYSLAQAEIPHAKPGEKLQLELRREVATPGCYAACDTHIHTLTHSGHGDCTLDERMITLVGEGIELPIATDHNIHVDYEAAARRMNVRQYFTSVVGNEVTTKVGHFNVFPIAAGARVANANLDDWAAIFRDIYATPGVKICILNHARDLHSGVRPFGPLLFNAAVGERLDGAPLRFNAMEVINSGATQSDSLQLLHDWMALLNRGQQVTPIGSSDSHDVSRFIVGQGRTYVRCDDRDPGQLDVAAAVDNLLAGRVLVSYGLLVQLVVDGKYTSGDFAAPSGDEIEATITVSSPHWINPSKVQLYANGQLLREEMIADKLNERGGVRWRETWRFSKPTRDLHLVAIAIGPGISAPYWATAQPYQPTSPELDLHTLACGGAVWVDGDGDGRRSSARAYAERLWSAADKQIGKLVPLLAKYDAAVASQAFFLYQFSGGDLEDAKLKDALAASPRPVRDGFQAFYAAWRECELARAGK